MFYSPNFYRLFRSKDFGFLKIILFQTLFLVTSLLGGTGHVGVETGQNKPLKTLRGLVADHWLITPSSISMTVLFTLIVVSIILERLNLAQKLYKNNHLWYFTDQFLLCQGSSHCSYHFRTISLCLTACCLCSRYSLLLVLGTVPDPLLETLP